jgi:hypothetical protein
MNAFHQLELIKVAASGPPVGWQYGVNPNSGLVDRYAPYQPAPGTAAALRQQGTGPGVIDNTWGDMAVSMIPGVGTAYLGNKAVQDFRRGNYWAGAGNTMLAGLSAIPGAGIIGAGLKLGGKGVKATLAGMKTAQGVKSTAGAIRAGAQAQGGLVPTVKTLTAGGSGAINSTIGMKPYIAGSVGSAAVSTLDNHTPPTNANAYRPLTLHDQAMRHVLNDGPNW